VKAGRGELILRDGPNRQFRKQSVDSVSAGGEGASGRDKELTAVDGAERVKAGTGGRDGDYRAGVASLDQKKAQEFRSEEGQVNRQDQVPFTLRRVERGVDSGKGSATGVEV
jgi:hypothetical protein